MNTANSAGKDKKDEIIFFTKEAYDYFGLDPETTTIESLTTLYKSLKSLSDKGNFTEDKQKKIQLYLKLIFKDIKSGKKRSCNDNNNKNDQVTISAFNPKNGTINISREKFNEQFERLKERENAKSFNQNFNHNQSGSINQDILKRQLLRKNLDDQIQQNNNPVNIWQTTGIDNIRRMHQQSFETGKLSKSLDEDIESKNKIGNHMFDNRRPIFPNMQTQPDTNMQQNQLLPEQNYNYDYNNMVNNRQFETFPRMISTTPDLPPPPQRSTYSGIQQQPNFNENMNFNMSGGNTGHNNANLSEIREMRKRLEMLERQYSGSNNFNWD